MDSIFHEKQEGQMCAKHCLNSLLQAAYFTELDLATIALQIDEQEKRQMAEGGLNNAEYLQFVSVLAFVLLLFVFISLANNRLTSR